MKKECENQLQNFFKNRKRKSGKIDLIKQNMENQKKINKVIFI
jgi:hypothetical protein